MALDEAVVYLKISPESARVKLLAGGSRPVPSCGEGINTVNEKSGPKGPPLFRISRLPHHCRYSASSLSAYFSVMTRRFSFMVCVSMPFSRVNPSVRKSNFLGIS